MAESIRVEVAYADPERQFLRAIEVPLGSTVADALQISGVVEALALDMSDLKCGIWSKSVAAETALTDGDRVELYRPLKIDPKEARRKRANAKRA
jgi:putative ubiquitin-RnfH superfamily antitoxin RatB of RatAB toxin-antitoxin module